MHPAISLFASNEFYHGKIQNGVKAEDRASEYELFKEFPIVLMDSTAGEVKRDTSYFNPDEV